MKSILLIVTLLAIAGCSNRQAYDSLQGARQRECSRIVDNTARDRCYQNANQSHDRYEQQRAQQ